MPWDYWVKLAQVIGPLIAVAAILAGGWQFLMSVRANRAGSALQAHQEYLRLCFDNPEFSSTEQYLRRHTSEYLARIIEERTESAVKYMWFLSFMLNSLEKTLEFVSAYGEWRKLANDQIAYHHGAIAEVWGEWKGHYGQTLIDIVEEALVAGPMPAPAGRGRAEPSPRARALLEGLRARPARSRSLREWLRTPLAVGLAAAVAGLFLLTWIISGNSGANPESQPSAPPATPPTSPPTRAVECVPCIGPNEGWQLLPWLEFAFWGLIIALIAWGIWRLVRPRTLADKAGLVAPAVPAIGLIWNWVKPQLAIELSDGLHNLLAIGLLGLLGWAFLVLIVGYPAPRKWRPFRLGVVILLGLVPILLFAIPTFRAGIMGAIMSDGRIEALYVGGFLAGAYFGGVWLACIGTLRRLWRANDLGEA